MKRKLFPNMKRITTLFSIAIICMTLTALTLRLTIFSEMASAASPGSVQAEPGEVESSLFPYSLSRNVYFATPGSRGDFLIENPETNDHYMMVSVTLPVTGETLLYTGFVVPGESRADAPLRVQLPEGVYHCIAEITAYDPDTLQPQGSEQREITLYIGEKS